jgi:hypothetical protein
MDSSIDKAEKIWDETENPEAAFFMAAAYGFKGRLHAERKNWTRATLAAKNALKYLEYSREFADFSPELMFGDGLYNYYYHFIKQNFPLLRPVLWLFPKANKLMGIQQLRKGSVIKPFIPAQKRAITCYKSMAWKTCPIRPMTWPNTRTKISRIIHFFIIMPIGVHGWEIR